MDTFGCRRLEEALGLNGFIPTRPEEAENLQYVDVHLDPDVQPAWFLNRLARAGLSGTIAIDDEARFSIVGHSFVTGAETSYHLLTFEDLNHPNSNG